jgi:peptide deformylase
MAELLRPTLTDPVDPSLVLPVVEIGAPVLRHLAAQVDLAALQRPDVQAAWSALLEGMKHTMRHAPGVGLAAPQIGRGLQLTVIEDRIEYQPDDAEWLAERGRRPVPFHVLVNPKLTLLDADAEPAVFFEGCLSVPGLVALVPRARRVHVDAFDEHGAPVSIDAEGWYARILQHEIDHLNGVVYVDRMWARSLCTLPMFAQGWGALPIAEVRARLGL